jgi:hypothetical protein
MKPACKAESRWLFWREERPRQSQSESFKPYKTLMARARRRNHKEEIRAELEEVAKWTAKNETVWSLGA